jgi:hypothetical protein
MTYNDNGNRYKHYQHWENVKNAPYDYERYGLLNKILSNRIYNTTNEYLKIILNSITFNLSSYMNCHKKRILSNFIFNICKL